MMACAPTCSPSTSLAAVPLARDVLGDLRARYPRLEPPRLVHELIRRLIARMIEDVVAASSRRIAERRATSPDDIRAAGQTLIGFSPAMAEADRTIKGFLLPRMYRHARVIHITSEAQDVVRDLFAHFTAAPRDLPDDWQEGLQSAGEPERARRVGDFIAGMTDNFALAEHAKYFDSTPELR